MLNYREVETTEVDCPNCGKNKGSNLEIIEIVDYLNLNKGQIFSYVKCPCGIYFLCNQPIEKELSKIYSTNYEAYKVRSGIVSRIKRERLRSVFKKVLNSKEGRVLDYGCGSGEFLSSVADLPGYSFVGFDINAPQSIDNKRIEFVSEEGILDNYGQFVAIFSFQVIEHVQNPLRLLNRFNGLLEPGGVLVLETPSPTGLLFSNRVKKFWGGWHAPRHFTILNEAVLRKMLIDANFEIIETKFIPSPFQWIETARAIIGNRTWLTLSNPFIVILAYTLDIIPTFFGIETSNLKVVARKRPT